MAIDKQGEEQTLHGSPGQVFEVYNGDWKALKEITKKWNFKDEVAALRFALAVLTEAEDGTLQIGETIVFPKEGLLNGSTKQ